MSTAVRLGPAGRPEIELPDVAAAFRILDQHCTAGVLLRTFTDRAAGFRASGAGSAIAGALAQRIWA
jgi:hypothetical protein